MGVVEFHCEMIQFCGETPFFAPKARQKREATPDLFLGMHIKKVIIQGCGSYSTAENPELFMPGVNAIRTRVGFALILVGVNGSGKSNFFKGPSSVGT